MEKRRNLSINHLVEWPQGAVWPSPKGAEGLSSPHLSSPLSSLHVSSPISSPSHTTARGTGAEPLAHIRAAGDEASGSPGSVNATLVHEIGTVTPSTRTSSPETRSPRRDGLGGTTGGSVSGVSPGLKVGTPQRAIRQPDLLSGSPQTAKEAYIAATRMGTAWDPTAVRPDPRTVVAPVLTGAFADSKPDFTSHAHLPEVMVAVNRVRAAEPLAVPARKDNAVDAAVDFYPSSTAGLQPSSAPSTRAPSPRTVRAVIWLDSGVELQKLKDASAYPPEYYYTVTGLRKRKPLAAGSRVGLGTKVKLNGKDLAIFRYRGAPLVFTGTCPHAGGDLSLGDIEDFNGSTCVCCPVHGFLFDCKGSGKSVSPPGTFAIATYPARLTPAGTVEVGFAGMDASVFTSDDF